MSVAAHAHSDPVRVGLPRQRVAEATRLISRNLSIGSDIAIALLEGSARDLGLPIDEVADDFIRGVFLD